MSKRKILIIDNSIDVTGALVAVVRSCSVLNDRWEFVFAIPTGSRAKSFVERVHFRVIELPMWEISRSWISWLLYIPALVANSIRLRKLIRSETIALVVVNDFYNLLMALLRWTGNRTPFFCYVRFLPSRFPNSLTKFWFTAQAKFAEAIIAVSQKVISELPAQSATLIYDGIETPDIPYDKRLRIILYPANYIPGKGHEYALNAFASLCLEASDWKLRFVGSDMGLKKNEAFKRSLIERCKSLPCNNQVEWQGPSDTMETEYRASAIVLNFSESESFSLTCLEALSFGRPVIATNSGGTTEIVDHGETGLIVPLADVSSMIEAMRLLIADDRLREQMAGEGRLRMKERFPLQNTARHLQVLFDAAVRKPLE